MDADENDGLSLGLAEVDVEHQLQLRLVQGVRAALVNHMNRETISALLGRLQDASDVHFGGEEILMRLHAWEGYSEHIEAHRRLLEELGALRLAFEQGHGEDLTEPLDQLQAWLIRHIRGPDRAFAQYVARGGLGAPVSRPP
jgi:hemerythrin-like metal-binding protein